MSQGPLGRQARRIVLRLLYGSVPSSVSYPSPVTWGESGSQVAKEVLVAGRPCLIGRFGSVELACVSYYVRWRAGRRFPFPYPQPIRYAASMNAGIFSNDDDSLDRFSRTYLDAVSNTDVMGVWFNRNEHRILGEYCPNARLVHLEALNCVLHARPWSSQLAGKTVLVVHPFTESIALQYRTRRTLLFENPDVLPEFDLKTTAAVQTIAGADSEFSTWFDALAHMKSQVANMDFDIAIIGAGAYGLPLAAHVKALGRQAVQLGGATQLLFGIRGRRWEVESPDDVAPLFNEHWIRPSAEETPASSDAVEGGCYW